MEKNELFQKLNNQDKDTLDLIRQLFNLIKQQREYNLLQDTQIEGLTNRVKKLEGRSK
jgi:predicted membrane chloride channel (bestrophin family)|tara:strand:- start:254 stop:427 length:174 start_codon:yes stop_codon:yes gene_type:complete